MGDTTAEGRLMQIGEVAERTGMSLPTLRHYDETGLLAPSGRSSGNFRLYSQADLERLMVIRRMKPLGFTVEEMRELLATYTGLRSVEVTPARREQLLGSLRATLADAVERRDRLRVQLDRADEFIEVLRSAMD